MISFNYQEEAIAYLPPPVLLEVAVQFKNNSNQIENKDKNMDIDRVIKAIQRNSHLTTRQMVQQYPELFEIKFSEQLKQINWKTQLDVNSRIAEIKKIACPLPPKGIIKDER